MDFDALIPTFLEITSTDDAQVARSYLEMSGGDLDTAVGLFFENGTVPAATNASPSVEPVESEAVTSESDEELARKLQEEMYQENNGEAEVRRPIEPVHEQLLQYRFGGGAAGSFAEPTDAVGRMFGSARRGVFNQGDDDLDVEEIPGEDEEEGEDDGEGIDNDSEIDYRDENSSDSDIIEVGDGVVVDLTGSSSSSANGRRRQRRIHDYRSSTQKRLARMFRPPWDIIDKLDLYSAKKKARESKKWVLVNIQDVTDFRCQCLNRDFWSSNQIKEFVKENFVFLQYQHDSANGEMYRNLYPFSDYPHIAIIDPWTGERMKMWSENPEVHKFIEQVVDFETRFSLDKNTLNPIVQHKQKLDLDKLSEERQIDLAMRESLGQDNGVNDTDDVVILEEGGGPIELDDDDEELSYSQKLKQIKSVDVADPQGDPKEITRIQIRSGVDGKRLVKKFGVADSVEKLFQYVKFAFKDSIGDKAFTLKLQRQNLFDSLNKSISEAGLKNASILLDIVSDED